MANSTTPGGVRAARDCLKAHWIFPLTVNADIREHRAMNRIPCIGVTGGIACGKSTFANYLREFGCEIFDTDDAAHELEDAGGEAVRPLVDAFGESILSVDGGINRKALSKIVFSVPGAIERLNSIVHPLVKDMLAKWRSAPLIEGCSIKAALVPLLFEVGWNRGDWDAVVCIVCSPEEQLKRLLGRGLTVEDAHRRVAAQWPIERKIELSDIVVRNDGDLLSLREEARRVVESFLERI